ncbi:hypothetical protein PSTG_13864 [Puccinia striiformis f. sp. tritici PST-78]|uniref:Uncharacterized protein n=1 Tax=Puccinia striiformis f. sp. tritici PST-78 TaxID=1165861 RepID=A0A0L0V0C6_9BASI|nr:hypothetical protein PSTG_13864 [Puccinia striiformis f. sp. tritici PST-78]
MLELAIMRDTWNVDKTLREKQDLAIMASNVHDKLTQLCNAALVRNPNYQSQLPPPPPPAATPMDINSITASVRQGSHHQLLLSQRGGLNKREDQPLLQALLGTTPHSFG